MLTSQVRLDPPSESMHHLLSQLEYMDPFVGRWSKWNFDKWSTELCFTSFETSMGPTSAPNSQIDVVLREIIDM